MGSVAYRKIFFAANGEGPYPCHFCGELVDKRSVTVHHEDNDRSNQEPDNLKATHHSCHISHHTKERHASSDFSQMHSQRLKDKWQDPSYRRSQAEYHSAKRLETDATAYRQLPVPSLHNFARFVGCTYEQAKQRLDALATAGLID